MKKQKEGLKVQREDWRTFQCTFWAVRFRHTLMKDKFGNAHYPFDQWIGMRKDQRYSPLVEVKVAEMAVETTYREIARVLSEWTAVQLNHTTVGSIVRRVGETQAQADKKFVEELEEAASLPQGKQIDYLFVEADGVFVRSMEKKKSHEVRHAVMYEGWEKNGKRESFS